LVFIIVVESVYSAVRTASLYKADYGSSLKGLECLALYLLSATWVRMKAWTTSYTSSKDKKTYTLILKLVNECSYKPYFSTYKETQCHNTREKSVQFICINTSNKMQLYYLGFYFKNSTRFGPLPCPSSGVHYCIGSRWNNTLVWDAEVKFSVR
jgi:hypothetical protein